MRIPTSDGAGQRGTRRRGRGRANPGSDRDTASPDADRAAASRGAASGEVGWRRAVGGHADSNRPGNSGLGPPVAGTRSSSAQYPAGPGGAGRGATPAGSSVFAPGYDGGRAGGDSVPARGGTQGSASWYGSSGGGAAGKGPVRGFPPAPGQPPPMYPPGQFAAWNAGQDSRSRQGGQPGPQDGTQPNRAEPGYSVLAVSDPAADVTSTQTWHAVADGRSTGTWTAPSEPGGQPASPRGASGRHGAPSVARPDAARPAAASRDLSGPRAVSAGVGRPGSVTGAAAPDTDGRGRSGPHSGPQAAVRTGRGLQAEPGPPSGKSPHSGPASGKRPASRKRPASVKLALSVATLLVLTAAATLAYTVLHRASTTPKSAAAASRQPKVTASPSTTPSLSPYGKIASRQSDPQPLTIAQLYPASFKIGGQPVTRAAKAISRHCSGAVTGSNLRSAIGSARCDQAVRATYLARARGLMGTVGVLNLGTAARAAKAVKAADASDFVTQLKGKRGPARRIGTGTGIEEALAKGHYLILIWAEFTNLHKPTRAAQRTKVETFMKDLLQNTANVSLATRMLTGSP